MERVDRCRHCSAWLPDTTEQMRFCLHCGQPLDDPRPPAASAWVELLDQVWDFFASVRVAVVLIALLALAAMAGSLIEQESLYQDWRPPELYYPDRYGEFWGPLLMKLGLTHTYTSWWFLTLVYLIVVSLIICSLQRLVPLHRALQQPTMEKSAAFVERQPIVATAPRPAGADPLAPLAEGLRRSGFRVWQRRDSLHADKGRLSRYGPYVIHIGLIICALAATLKAVPGWDVTEDMWIEEGQTVVIPGTQLALRNDDFIMKTHADGTPALFQTNAVLLDNGVEAVRHSIRVNHPLAYGGWELYQASFKAEPGWVDLTVVDADTGQPTGRQSLRIDLKSPVSRWDLGRGLVAVVESYYPDAELDPETGELNNRSRDILNPLFLLRFEDAAGQEVGRQALVISVRPGVAPPLVGSGPVMLRQTNVDMRWFTGIKAHKDRTVPYMYAGLGIVLLGMMQTFFLFHRQVWAVATPEGVAVGARTNKNPWGAEQELRRLLAPLGGRLTRGLTVRTGAEDPDDPDDE